MRKVVASLAMMAALSACKREDYGPVERADSNTASAISAAALESSMAAARANASWVYTDEPDRMFDTPTHTACVASTDRAPVADGASGTSAEAETSLCIVRRGDGHEAASFHTTAGAFNCTIWPQLCAVLVRVDGAAPFRVFGAQLGGDGTTLIVDGPEDLIAAARSGKAMLIQLPFVGTGAQVTQLNIAGLDARRMGFGAAPKSIAVPTYTLPPDSVANSVDVMQSAAAKAAPPLATP